MKLKFYDYYIKSIKIKIKKLIKNTIFENKQNFKHMLKFEIENCLCVFANFKEIENYYNANFDLTYMLKCEINFKQIYLNALTQRFYMKNKNKITIKKTKGEFYGYYTSAQNVER
jgi:hypothetical protein